jgi:hypothetical protein
MQAILLDHNGRLALLLRSVLLLTALLLIGACGVQGQGAAPPNTSATSPATPPTEIPPTAAPPTETPIPPTVTPPAATPTVAVAPTEGAGQFDGLAPTDIVVQLDYEPGFSRPEVFVPFGRVPRFTLLADGRVFYVDSGEPPSYDSERLMQVQLSPQEAAAFLQRVLDAGFARVESYTDFCLDTGSGQQECVADAATSVLRVRMSDGTLREVKNYHDFATDREALVAVRSLLTDYRNEAAQPATPERLTAFLQRAQGDTTSLDVQPWPLAPEWLMPPEPQVEQWARVLEGSERDTLLAALPRNMGDFFFERDGAVYAVYLVPWLPGQDYAADVSGYRMPRP